MINGVFDHYQYFSVFDICKIPRSQEQLNEVGFLHTQRTEATAAVHARTTEHATAVHGSRRLHAERRLCALAAAHQLWPTGGLVGQLEQQPAQSLFGYVTSLSRAICKLLRRLVRFQRSILLVYRMRLLRAGRLQLLNCCALCLGGGCCVRPLRLEGGGCGGGSVQLALQLGLDLC